MVKSRRVVKFNKDLLAEIKAGPNKPAMKLKTS